MKGLTSNEHASLFWSIFCSEMKRQNKLECLCQVNIFSLAYYLRVKCPSLNGQLLALPQILSLLKGLTRDTHSAYFGPSSVTKRRNKLEHLFKQTFSRLSSICGKGVPLVVSNCKLLYPQILDQVGSRLTEGQLLYLIFSNCQ
jgi:hypothetical protein